MAPVIWGLDLAELKWSKFKNSYMWNKEYHLRRTKFIVYQCALIFCVISESLGTDVLSDYTSGQSVVERLSKHRVAVSNDDYVGAASYNIFAGVFVAFIFGAAFFFDLFWPERKESRSVRIAWKVCGVFAVIFHLASALTITIITATHQSHIRDVRTGRISSRETFWWSKYHKHGEAPLDYKHNGRAIAAVVFAWLGTCSVIPSCVLLFLSIDNVEHGLGPKSAHARRRSLRDARRQPSSDPDADEKALEQPEQAHPPEMRTDGYEEALPAAETTPSGGYER